MGSPGRPEASRHVKTCQDTSRPSRGKQIQRLNLSHCIYENTQCKSADAFLIDTVISVRMKALSCLICSIATSVLRWQRFGHTLKHVGPVQKFHMEYQALLQKEWAFALERRKDYQKASHLDSFPAICNQNVRNADIGSTMYARLSMSVNFCRSSVHGLCCPVFKHLTYCQRRSSLCRRLMISFSMACSSAATIPQHASARDQAGRRLARQVGPQESKRFGLNLLNGF